MTSRYVVYEQTVHGKRYVHVNEVNCNVLWVRNEHEADRMSIHEAMALILVFEAKEPMSSFMFVKIEQFP